MRLVLASASPRRLALLQQIGVTPAEICTPDIDETSREDETARALALRLATGKAMAVARDGCVVLSADTVVACGRRLLPKTETETEAHACLRLLSGRAHQVMTAVAVKDREGRVRTRLGAARVRLMRLSDADIDSYIASGEWRGKAGGYAIQGRAGRFVSALSGSFTAVVGLPLQETAFLLRAAGVEVP